MTDTNQKLREALRIAVNYIDMDALYTFAGVDHDTIKEALATTEPEPTGMPPAPEPDIHYIYIGLGWKPATAQQYAETHRQKCAMHSTIQLQTYGEQCWKAGYKHGAWADKPEPTSKQSLQVEPAVNQQLTTEPVDEREARATLPTQRSSMDGLPKPFGYVSDGFADSLRFQHNPWPVEHTLLHSTMPVFSAAAVQQFKQDAERYRWLASSESVAMNAKTKDHQWAISDAWTTLEKLDADKALIDAAIDAAMAKGVKG